MIEGIENKQHYLVPENMKIITRSLYRPSYYNKMITLETSPDDFWEQYHLKRQPRGRKTCVFVCTTQVTTVVMVYRVIG